MPVADVSLRARSALQCARCRRHRAMTPESAATIRQLLAFYLEAGVDCALAEDPVNRLSDPGLAAAASEPALVRTMAAPVPASAAASRPRRRRGGDPVGTISGADGADARGVARADGAIRRLRAEIDRHAPGVRRRQPAGADHVRRRGSGTRGRPRRPALRRPFRQAAGPDDGGDRARSHKRLHCQCDSLAAARQPHPDAAGNPDLPAVHPAPDRTGQSGRAGDARQSRRPDPAVDPRRHHEEPRQMAGL